MNITIEPSGWGEKLYNLEMTNTDGQLLKYVIGADRSDVLRELKDQDPQIVELALQDAENQRNK